MTEFNLDRLAEAWSAPIVSRSQVGVFSGHILHPRTCANLDSLGLGCKKIMIGRKVAYDKWELVAWMKAKQEPTE